MAGLFIYRSNRLEALGERLAEIVREPLPSPLQPEQIVVQSLGMRRWVSFALASRLGVTMNCQFPFFQEFSQLLLGGNPAEAGFSRSVLPWRVFSVLPSLLGRPGFESLHRYRGSDPQSQLKQFQLAGQIAAVFDRYLAYSPERLLAWETNSDQSWQAQLWRALAQGAASRHPPRLLQEFTANRAAGGALPAGVSPRVSVFGVSFVPPFHLHLLAAAASALTIHLFLLEPTDHYWGDLLSRKEQRRILRRPALADRTASELHLEAGNELLASFGRAGKTFARDVQELDPHGFTELFVPPAGDSLLQAVQRDIFEVQETSGNGPESHPAIPRDHSLQVHCCHSPMRELQVLHDRLLDLFERLPGLMPKDVLVTMPDVEKYAALVEAVFDTTESEPKRIPYSIADRSARAENQVARALLSLLELHGSRFGASTVLELLEIGAVRERFGIAEGELDLLREWTAKAGIRWGIDGAHRGTFGLPDFEQNSWRSGFDRLLLGYALPGDEQTLFDGILPMGDVEGGHSALLGRFIDFGEKLFRAASELTAPRTLPEWETTLRALLETFIADRDEYADALRRVRGAVRQIGALSDWHPGVVPYEVLHAHMIGVFSEAETGYGFLAGHVTFCSLKPMRSVPFRVICVLGMNDDAFPRHEPQLSFDLLAQESRGAGRSRRDDDRQLFLETILSARDTLYLSYCGRSPKDNSEAPPSVVVSELLDYLADHYPPVKDEPRFVIHHPLQAFSGKYFGGAPELFSYSAEASIASSAASGPRLSSLPLPPLLPPISDAERLLDLEDLANFVAHPTKFFLEQRLRARMPKLEEIGVDCEPLEIAGLSRWKLQTALASRGLESRPNTDSLALARAQGVLPAGFFGSTEFAEIASDLREVLPRVVQARRGGAKPARAERVRCGGWEIVGVLTDRYPGGIVQLIGWQMRARDRLRAWVRHLFLSLGSETKGQTTQLFCTDRKIEFSPIADADSVLADLLEVYAEGQREPLPFFSETSFTSAKGRHRGEDVGYLLQQAWKRESTDAHIERCFRHRPAPLDARWAELAARICGPMLEAMTEEKFA